jgi:beta-lactamase regulating signal transducer with metallopeptidase domain
MDEPNPDEASSGSFDFLSESTVPDLVTERGAVLDMAPAIQRVSLAIPWKEIVAGVWLTGSFGWLVLLAVRIRRFRGQLAFARSLSKPLRDQLDGIARRIGVKQVPEIRIVPGQIPPLLWTVSSRPRLFLPSSLWQKLSEDQQVALLAHELAHLRRRDHWVRYLELLVTALYWWHPVVWWACRQMREAEEECCDAWVVWALPGTARAYARALVATVDFLSETGAALPLAASGIGQVRDLRRRLVMIMNGKTPRMLSGGGAFIVLALGVVLLPWMPTWAQDKPAGSPEPFGRPDVAAPQSADIKALDQLRQDEQTLLEQTRRAKLMAQRGEDAQEEGQERGKAEEMERAQKEMRQAQEQLEHMQREIVEAGRRFERAKAQFAEQKERLARRMAQLEQRQRAVAQGDRSSTRRGGGEGRGEGSSRTTTERRASPDQERRLDELERKLEAVMEEVRSLRRDMRQRDGGPTPPAGRSERGRAPRRGPAAEPPSPPESSDDGAGPAPRATPSLPAVTSVAPQAVPVPNVSSEAIPVPNVSAVPPRRIVRPPATTPSSP